MKTMKGPAIFLAQFMGDEPPFNSLDAICAYMAGLGYKGVQIPTWESRLFRAGSGAQQPQSPHGVGRSAAEMVRQSQPQPGIRCACVLFRCLALALYVPLAPTPGRPGGNGF